MEHNQPTAISQPMRRHVDLVWSGKVIRSRPLECIADGRVTRVLHGFT